MCTNLKRSVRSIISAHLRGLALSLGLFHNIFLLGVRIHRTGACQDASRCGFVQSKTFSMRKKRCRPFWSKRSSTEATSPLNEPDRRVACAALFTVLLYCASTIAAIAAPDEGQIRARVEEERVCVCVCF